MINGHLDIVKDNCIYGWLGSRGEEVIPFITANGQPCKLLAHSMTRDDVASVTGLSPEVGFIAEIPPLEQSTVEFKLHALSFSGHLTPVSQDTFALPTVPSPAQPVLTSAKHRNVVLVWKQHDAGLYGRRVDQIARALATSRVYRQVTVMEVMSSPQLAFYEKSISRTDSDVRFLYEDFFEKQKGMQRDKVLYKSFLADADGHFQSQLRQFLKDNELYPSNTLFILFPVITECAQLREVIQGYKIICDMVDNQLSWSQDNPFPLLQEYTHLCHIADAIIFNSAVNQSFFVSRSIADEKKSVLIPNWYRLPESFVLTKVKVRAQNQVNILYSGNMNDRVDWDLLHALHEATAPHVIFHLVGSADKISEALEKTLSRYPRFRYQGPLRETDLLTFAQRCDLAIMPHKHDECSHYMNPLKLHMYAALKLHCIATNVPGIDKNAAYLTVCDDEAKFIAEVVRYIRAPYRKTRFFTFNKNKSITMYLREVKKIFKGS